MKFTSWPGVMVMVLCLAARGGSGQAVGVTLTQRRINELAASLQRARFAVVEETGVRLPEEPLNRYLDRITKPLSGESFSSCSSRIARYAAALSVASDATAEGRVMPILRDGSPGNQALWRHIVKDLGQLPERVVRLRAAWKAIRNPQTRHWKRSVSQEMTETMAVVLSAYSALRDARP